MFKNKNYVNFLSPGSFVSECSSVKIENCDIKLALEKSKTILERYNAKPYGFYFETRLCHDDLNDGHGNLLKVESKTMEKSGMYYITGEIYTIEDIKARKNDKDEILISNMECNNWPLVIENFNSFKTIMEFKENDFIVALNGNIVESGTDSKYVEYRRKSNIRYNQRWDNNKPWYDIKL
jgi:hypothetical protein